MRKKIRQIITAAMIHVVVNELRILTYKLEVRKFAVVSVTYLVVSITFWVF